MDTILSFIIQEAIKYGPSVITEIESLFANGTPTLADLQALRAKLEAESYAKFVPASVLPPDASDIAAAAAPAVTESATVAPANATPAAPPVVVNVTLPASAPVTAPAPAAPGTASRD